MHQMCGKGSGDQGRCGHGHVLRATLRRAFWLLTGRLVGERQGAGTEAERTVAWTRC